MDFELTKDQLELQRGIDSLLDRYRTPPKAQDRLRDEVVLERELVDSGYLDVARFEGLGSFEAVLLTEAVARLPLCLEVAASAIVAPAICDVALTRPVALTAAPIDGAVRFLQPGGSVFIETADDVRLLQLAELSVFPVESTFIYHYGRLPADAVQKARPLPGVTPQKFRQYWQLAVAAALVGAMDAALDLTLEYVKMRKQFGRPLGAFQSMQHRLAESAMLVHSARLLTYKAAVDQTGVNAALAAAYAQEAAGQIVYNVHQFHGAMGLTTEYPLHFWTQRLRVLQGEAGGCTSIARAAAQLIWA